MASKGYRERNSTADRALEILQMFGDDRLVLSGAEVSEHLGVARSTGYRYLQSLVGAGFIEDADDGFRLGSQIFELARLARKGLGLTDIAFPVMQRLAAQSGETVLLTRLSGGVVVCLDRVQATQQSIHLSYERGQVLPVNAGAASTVLLAWKDPDDIESTLAASSLRRFTDRSLTDPDRLKGRLKEIRDRGVAVSRGEVDPDIVGVAAPIFGRKDDVRAAISIAALAARLPTDKVSDAEEMVIKAANEVSQQLALIES